MCERELWGKLINGGIDKSIHPDFSDVLPEYRNATSGHINPPVQDNYPCRLPNGLR